MFAFSQNEDLKKSLGSDMDKKIQELTAAHEAKVKSLDGQIAEHKKSIATLEGKEQCAAIP